ncbi:hypothetical protein HF673_18220 [Acidithiobacillus thiooxidans]|uniref:hypothetical protein n=1 Tax=Acidithiobacillus thiooxidans TaxID=930 RepID=UPI001C07CD42|nr:hypothetical protein [Acidithiobacillus thiooxidans]MBU2837620.1 hypothetical protein [Acidithiobacillus thiooxidans]
MRSFHLQIACGIATIGEKHDLPVHLQALRFQDFVQAAVVEAWESELFLGLASPD